MKICEQVYWVTSGFSWAVTVLNVAEERGGVVHVWPGVEQVQIPLQSRSTSRKRIWCQSVQETVPLCYWLTDWGHHQAPVLVFWTLLFPHSQLSNQMFGWFPSRASLKHRHHNFTLLQRKIWQGEHEDFIEDGHQAAGHYGCFLVSQLALVALHTDPGIQGYTTQRRQIRNCVFIYCVYVHDFIFINMFVIYLHLSTFQWWPFWPLAVQPQSSAKWEETLKTEALLLQDPVETESHFSTI